MPMRKGKRAPPPAHRGNKKRASAQCALSSHACLMLGNKLHKRSASRRLATDQAMPMPHRHGAPTPALGNVEI